MTTTPLHPVARRARTALAMALAAVFVAGAVSPAAAIGTTAADEYAMSRLGADYGSASFRHHFYRNVPNNGLSNEDHDAFLDAKDARFD